MGEKHFCSPNKFVVTAFRQLLSVLGSAVSSVNGVRVASACSLRDIRYVFLRSQDVFSNLGAQTLPHSPKLEVNLRVRVHPSTILATSVIVSLFTGYKSVVTVGKQRRIHQNFCCSCWLPLFPRNTHRFATQ